MRHLSIILGCALLTQATACVTITAPRFMRPAPERAWEPTLASARALAASGNVMAADSVLAAYAAAYPQSSYATETLFWRPVLQLQSPTPPSSLANAAMMLGMYTSHSHVDHKLEAEVMRQTILRVDSLSRISTNLSSRVQISNGEVSSANARAADARADAKAVNAETKDQDAEIRRLRDELAKSKEELERIKKRLSEPPAKKPPY